MERSKDVSKKMNFSIIIMKIFLVIAVTDAAIMVVIGKPKQ
jgi:hypothetical protein